MSINFPTATAEIRRTTDLPSSFRFSLTFWLQLTASVGDFGTVFDSFSSDSGGVGVLIYLDPTANNISLWNWLFDTDVGSSLTVDQWYHVGLVNSGTSSVLYLDGVLDANLSTTNAASNTLDYIEFAGVTAGEPFRGNIGPIKMWTASLSQSEIQREMWITNPLRTNSLYGAWPTLSGAGERNRDYSGNGRDWTENNSPGDGPPAPAFWAGGLIQVGLPGSGTVGESEALAWAAAAGISFSPVALSPVSQLFGINAAVAPAGTGQASVSLSYATTAGASPAPAAAATAGISLAVTADDAQSETAAGAAALALATALNNLFTANAAAAVAISADLEVDITLAGTDTTGAVSRSLTLAQALDAAIAATASGATTQNYDAALNAAFAGAAAAQSSITFALTLGQTVTATAAGSVAASFAVSAAVVNAATALASAGIQFDTSWTVEIAGVNADLVFPTPGSRTFVIESESRVYLVNQETRTITILAENRTYEV